MKKTEARTGAILTIDLKALVDNWRLLRDRVAPRQCAAVVKADAYGLGMNRVAQALWNAGCKVFFVAQIEEATTLRKRLREAEIHVLNGLLEGTESDFLAQNLIPVLNDIHQIRAWTQFCGQTPRPCDIHLDTGMSRLGLSPEETEQLIADTDLCQALAPSLIMSHLACADSPNHKMNSGQLEEFTTLRQRLDAAGLRAPGSIANSSGIFLGADYHFDLARPGVAIYGVNPTPDNPNPMAQVVRLQAKILQVRTIDTPRAVGYGATHRVWGPSRIATVGVGYADGFLRTISNRGRAFIKDHRAPVVGRISMDLTTLDVTAVPEQLTQPGCMVDLIGPHSTVDDVAQAAGTIGYEILTGLGNRFLRVYSNGPGA
ncbi:alanine racemase [Magnetospira sp. QH-2]|uniref:alanine racemase n=1 Tax=Magnetospira sp. (strain QH-2) TaxID=1288970 RepID=UPI0003E81982|nr:alanine racemase [Magnetospira sp. QH-2]CCQ74433.1 putative alanine racemase (alr) [Magnetospira sp. QH-2]